MRIVVQRWFIVGLPPHQLALAIISLWNAEVAAINARRKACAAGKS